MLESDKLILQSFEIGQVASVSCVTAERWSRDIHPRKKEDTKNRRDGFLSLVVNFSCQLLPLILRPSRRAGRVSVATIFDIPSNHFGKL